MEDKNLNQNAEEQQSPEQTSPQEEQNPVNETIKKTTKEDAQATEAEPTSQENTETVAEDKSASIEPKEEAPVEEVNTVADEATEESKPSSDEATEEAPVEEVKTAAAEAKEETPVEEVKTVTAEATEETPAEDVKTATAEATEEAPVEEVNTVADEATEETPDQEVKTATDEATEETPVEEVKTAADEATEETPVQEVKTASDEATEETPDQEVKTATDEATEESKPSSAEATEESKPSSAEATEGKEKKEIEDLHKEEEEIDRMAEEAGDHDEEDSDDEEEEEKEEEDTTVYEELSLDQLVELMESLVQAEDISTVKTKVLKTNLAYQSKFKAFKEEHKEKFLENEENKEEDYQFDDGGLNSRFHQAFYTYKQKRKEYMEAQEILKQNNLKRKEEVLEELRTLIDSEESLKKIYDEFKNLQEKWRQIGMVPKNDAKNLWMNYNFLVDKFFEKVQIDRELRDIGYKKNLDAKIALAEKAEELLLEKSFTKAFKMLQEYFRQWKEIGPVPYDKSEEIWERFKGAADKVNQRRREYYQNMAEEQKNNLVLKKELIEKAQAISNPEYTTIKEYNQKTKELEELMTEWKKLGPAPKAQNDEIWKEFRVCFNAFYSNKKQYFSALNEELNENYQAKLDLCKTAESLQESTDWRNTTRELKKLQQEWKKIGRVPYKYSDKIWKRFRAACDAFFNAKEEYFKSMKDAEDDNLKLKKELIEKIKTNTFSEDKEKAMAEMKELQKQWIEIGQVPFKQKDKINKEYRAMVDEKLSEIGLSAVDVELARIKERSGQGDGDAKESRFVIQKEINLIKGKIDKIQSEIITWENNMGFFANSKNADVLKNEFQTKIDNANKNIKSMKARMRLLDKTLRTLKE